MSLTEPEILYVKLTLVGTRPVNQPERLSFRKGMETHEDGAVYRIDEGEESLGLSEK